MPGSFRGVRTLSNYLRRSGQFVNGASKFGGRRFGGGRFSKTTYNNNAGNNTGSGQQSTTGTDRFRKQSPWGPTGKFAWSGIGGNFQDAIFGKNKRNKAVTLNNDKKDKSALPEGLLGMKIKVDPSLKGDKVKYNHRTNTVSVGNDQKLNRRELPKQLIKLAEGSKRFRDTTGLGNISNRDRRQLNSSLRRKRLKLERANKKLHSSGTSRSRSKSTRRKVIFDDLVK